MEVLYYVATSLDGCIADRDGGVDWLTPFQGGGEDHGYAEMYASVDAILMGSRTYELALRVAPEYEPDKPTSVFTKRDLPVPHPAATTLTGEDPRKVVEDLAARGHRRAWLMGGGELAASFLERGLITHHQVFVVPVVLGGGIPLFGRLGGGPIGLEMTGTHRYANGIVRLDYEPAATDRKPGG